VAGGPGAADNQPSDEAVDEVFDSAADNISLEGENLLRSFNSVRYERSGEDKPATGHDFLQIDHGEQDDCWGMTTVLGGSVTTHRLVAEQVADDVCAKFGISRDCQTADLPLPGSEPEPGGPEGSDPLPTGQQDQLPGGSIQGIADDLDESPVICECQSVTRAAASNALDDDTATDCDLDEIRIRTGATMGECQGGKCAHRLAAKLPPGYDTGTVDDALHDLLEGRWRGQRHTLQGERLADAARMYRLHASTMSRKHPQPEELRMESFESGPLTAPDTDIHGEGWDLDPQRCCLRGGGDD